MDFKDLKEALAYIDAKESELKDTKAQLDALVKEKEEIKTKNDELIKTNSQLLSDIVNMGKSKDVKGDENEIEDLYIEGDF